MELQKQQKPPLWLKVCLIIWLPGSLVTLFLLNDRLLTEFISSKSHQAFYDETSVFEAVSPWLNSQELDLQTAFHFYRGNCRCNSLVNKHLRQIKNNPKVKLQYIDLDKVDLPFDVPATPSLLITDKNNRPKYFGAYGFGQFCQPSGNSIWAQIIEQPVGQTIFLNTMGKGCFCSEVALQSEKPITKNI